MGDFNDPFHGINDLNPLEINDCSFITGSGPVKSCCYNFNSACSSELLNNTNEKVTDSRGTAKPKECFVGIEDHDIPRSLDYKYPERGYLNTYQFTGDYCMGLKPIQGLSIYRPNKELISSESDHEMVYAIFDLK